MTGVLGACLFVVIVPLFLILGLIVYRGAGALSVEFFTERPSVSGGGMAHAIGGQLHACGVGDVVGGPHRGSWRQSSWPSSKRRA